MTLTASLLLSLLPQVFPGGDIQLPPAKPKSEAQVVAKPLTDGERFRRDLLDLAGREERAEQRLRTMAEEYSQEQLEKLIVDVARSARNEELIGLARAARRFGRQSRAVADELLFQLLSRSLGEPTRVVLQTMVELQGAAAKKSLQECVRARVTGVRRHAVELLAPMLTTDDVPFVLLLSREQALDLQLRAVDLLAAVPEERTLQRLVELLAKDPALAGAAAGALVKVGAPAVPVLQQQLSAPPIDRAFAYAGFALAQLAQQLGPQALPAAGAAALAARVRDPEALTRALVAVPLADCIFRGDAVSGEGLEAAVVEALLDVVAPTQFVPNLDLLKAPANDRLELLTGRIAIGAEVRLWREWWSREKPTFVGARAALAVDESNVPEAVLQWRQEKRLVRIVVEDLADQPPVEDATEIVLPRAAMLALLASLRAAGYQQPAAMRVPGNLPIVRSLQLQVGARRCIANAPAGDVPAFTAWSGIVQQLVADNLWQLFRPAGVARGDAWRAESAWRAANLDENARASRLAIAIAQSWPKLGEELRVRGLEFLVAHPQRSQLLGEEHAKAVVAMLGTAEKLGELDLRLLEVAASAPGDVVWRQAVRLAAQKGGRNAVRAVFAVLGDDAVLASLQDDEPVVRRAGIEEVLTMRDHRAFPRLVELLKDADLEARRLAIYACGTLRVAAASRPLVAQIAAEDATPELRREAMVALGRTGGDLAFPVLQRAMAAPDQADRDAALRALGELADLRAAHLLAELVVVGNGKDLGNLATASLLRQGALLAVPALRVQLAKVQDRTIRTQLVLALGAYQDPEVLSDLIDLLRDPRHAASAASLFACTTGFELVDSPERGSRLGQAEVWYRQQRQKPQWQWLLDAFAANKIETSLQQQSFVGKPTKETVFELTRLLVDGPVPHLWPLTVAVLRNLTGEEHGNVTLHATVEQRKAIAELHRFAVTAVGASSR